MSWIASAGDSPPFEGLFAHRPELLTRYKAFYSALWDGDLVPRRVLELCRLRVAAIHDCAAEWAVRDAGVALDSPEAESLKRGDFAAFAASEQAALAIAEQFPFQHHGVSDADVAAAAEAFGDAGAVALMVALAFFDATCRWKLAFDLGEQPADLDSPPLHQGALV
ncbi:MAG: hypothetical protein OXG51_11545 [Gammaproteobacteria bacterium]|nr:hypothetical protein [Gammaproteobacteria bacterium]